MIKGVIFDHDDVLAETEPLHCRSTIDALARYGIALTEEVYYDFWTRRGGDLGKFLEERGINAEQYKRFSGCCNRHFGYCSNSPDSCFWFLGIDQKT